MTTRLKSFFSDKSIYIAVFCLLLLYERRAFSTPYRNESRTTFETSLTAKRWLQLWFTKRQELSTTLTIVCVVSGFVLFCFCGSKSKRQNCAKAKRRSIFSCLCPPSPPYRFLVRPLTLQNINSLNRKIKIWMLICCLYSFPTEVQGRSW